MVWWAAELLSYLWPFGCRTGSLASFDRCASVNFPTAVKEINKSNLKVNLLLLPLSHGHLRSQCSVYEKPYVGKTEQGSAARSELGRVPGFT